MKRGLMIGIFVGVIILIAILSFTFVKDDSSLDQTESIEETRIEPIIEQEETVVQLPSELGNEETEIIQQEYVVEMTSAAFNPKTIEINKGDKVNFVNVGTSSVWPATASHPSHTVYPGSSIGKCGTGEENLIFDACKRIEQGETYSFTFNEVGTWRYHNHLSSGMTGTIIVN